MNDRIGSIGHRRPADRAATARPRAARAPFAPRCRLPRRDDARDPPADAALRSAADAAARGDARASNASASAGSTGCACASIEQNCSARAPIVLQAKPGSASPRVGAFVPPTSRPSFPRAARRERCRRVDAARRRERERRGRAMRARHAARLRASAEYEVVAGCGRARRAASARAARRALTLRFVTPHGLGRVDGRGAFAVVAARRRGTWRPRSAGTSPTTASAAATTRGRRPRRSRGSSRSTPRASSCGCTTR